MSCAGGVYDGVFLHCPFSHEMSWMTSWTLLIQFLRVFLPTLAVLWDRQAKSLLLFISYFYVYFLLLFRMLKIIVTIFSATIQATLFKLGRKS